MAADRNSIETRVDCQVLFEFFSYPPPTLLPPSRGTLSATGRVYNRLMPPCQHLIADKMFFRAKTRPLPQKGPRSNKFRRRPTFPHSYPCSIIGAAGLNFCVRDGNRCDPCAIATENRKTGFQLPKTFTMHALCTGTARRAPTGSDSVMEGRGGGGPPPLPSRKNFLWSSLTVD